MHTDAHPAEITSLNHLAAELIALGFNASLITPPGRLPYLQVSNPRSTMLTERVYTQAGVYFWSWAEPITGCEHPANAATAITRVLRTTTDSTDQATATGSSTPTSHPTLADLEREFGWICWHDGDQYYARRPTTPASDHDARGEDPTDLREAIHLNLPQTRH